MKQIFYQIAIIVLTILLSASKGFTQEKKETVYEKDNLKIVITEDGDTTKKRKGLEGMKISIGTNGIKISDAIKKKKKHKKLHVGMNFDFGINNVIDNTKYPNSNLDVIEQPDNIATATPVIRDLTKADLALRNAKSINFNFWPVMLRQDVAKHNVQIQTGLGFQFFNYRFQNDIRPAGVSMLDGDPFFSDLTNNNEFNGKPKNKLGVSYVSIPLMLRFNSNKRKGHRYFFGAGVIGSYKLKSWSKFYGQKESMDYGINDWMTQATVELGVTGILKLYGTYALQSMYKSDQLNRQPFAIGIRL